ncbi:hypothetical protein N7474_010502 [Penicillium riverlandense]|uniref:uncharacterized protein n=1 Tax=Penicillium riverlandense TaxID=1903569 RepID=UPI002547EE11|nr:uncharacterized protein N7474_010502 [Penicillium riverlandense]KAJ5806910.1 hypothetical protein N7474_010502 [Penicillium riverlandense]
MLWSGLVGNPSTFKAKIAAPDPSSAAGCIVTPEIAKASLQEHRVRGRRRSEISRAIASPGNARLGCSIRMRETHLSPVPARRPPAIAMRTPFSAKSIPISARFRHLHLRSSNSSKIVGRITRQAESGCFHDGDECSKTSPGRWWMERDSATGRAKRRRGVPDAGDDLEVQTSDCVAENRTEHCDQAIRSCVLSGLLGRCARTLAMMNPDSDSGG